MDQVLNFKSIPQAHQAFGFPPPCHEYFSIIRHDEGKLSELYSSVKYSLNFYAITLKLDEECNWYYGKRDYDFKDGGLIFTAPGQVVSFDSQRPADTEGWTILFHSEFIRGTHLADTIDDYTFFSYSTNEALFIRQEEIDSINHIVQKIRFEFEQKIDDNRKEIVAHNIETILKYSQRYYDRQFKVRHKVNSDILVRFEKYLKDYFSSYEKLENGIPTVKSCGDHLGLSGYYLSDMIKKETDQSAKDHIYFHLIEKAKSEIIIPKKTISEVAYCLGFKTPQHFSKLFKLKTGTTPKEYKATFKAEQSC